jgi:hypothetical protein
MLWETTVEFLRLRFGSMIPEQFARVSVLCSKRVLMQRRLWRGWAGVFFFFYPDKIVWHTTHRTKFAFKCGTNIALCFYFSQKNNKKNVLFLSFGFSFDFINYSVDYLILLHLFLFSASLQLIESGSFPWRCDCFFHQFSDFSFSPSNFEVVEFISFNNFLPSIQKLQKKEQLNKSLATLLVAL